LIRGAEPPGSIEDDAAGAFWENAGYPRDDEIGRRVRNL
jgi:hypothetical protein